MPNWEFYVKPPKKPTTFLRPDEVQTLLDAMPVSRNKRHARWRVRQLRDRALVATLFATGLRISEALSLPRTVVELDEFAIVGKGGFQRPAYLTDQAKAYIREYLATRRDDRPKLFELTPRSAERMVKQAAARVGLRATPHTFRHSYATHLLWAGADVRSVQYLLGHKSLNTLQRYAHVTDAHLKEVHQRFHSGNQP